MEIRIFHSELFKSYIVVEAEPNGNLLGLSPRFDNREDAEQWAIDYMEFLIADRSKVCKVYRIKDGKNILVRLYTLV